MAPLLFTLIFMMFEASRFLMGVHAVTGAAREAARVYSVRGDENSARTAAVDYLKKSSFKVDNVNVDFTISASAIPEMQNFSCTVEIDYEDVSLLGDPFHLGASEVRGYAAMMNAGGG